MKREREGREGGGGVWFDVVVHKKMEGVPCKVCQSNI
jgi:hypothetical protein